MRAIFKLMAQNQIIVLRESRDQSYILGIIPITDLLLNKNILYITKIGPPLNLYYFLKEQKIFKLNLPIMVNTFKTS